MVCSVVHINTDDGSFGVNHQGVAPLLWPDSGLPQQDRLQGGFTKTFHYFLPQTQGHLQTVTVGL